MGRTLTVNGGQVEIIGVLPQGFRFPTMEAELFFPFRLDRCDACVGRFNYQAIARLRPGITLEEAHADVRRMIPLTVEKFPSDAWNPEVVGTVSAALWLILGAVGIVLAHRLRERGQPAPGARRRPPAGRGRARGTGADRLAVIREFFLEALTLGVLGGLLAPASAQTRRRPARPPGE